MGLSKYICVCQYVKKEKRPISKNNDVISYRLKSINGNFSTNHKSKMALLIKSEVQLVIPDVVSFYYSLATDALHATGVPCQSCLTEN